MHLPNRPCVRIQATDVDVKPSPGAVVDGHAGVAEQVALVTGDVYELEVVERHRGGALPAGVVDAKVSRLALRVGLGPPRRQRRITSELRD